MKKTVIITGASSGIGRALALEFASRGYNVGIAARRLEKLQALQHEMSALPGASGIQVALACLDVKDTYSVEPALQQLFAEFDRVDVVVVNAGVNQLTRVGKGQLAEEVSLIQTNLVGAVATVNAAAQYFKTQGGGHVVGISSLASLSAIPTQAAYCATKAGFSMYMDAAAIELKKHKVRFTKILPGFVKTDIVENMDQYPFLISAEQAAKEIVGHVEKGSKEGVVPAFPWRIMKPLMGKIPDGLWKYMM